MKVLVATDGSEPSIKAVQRALELAEQGAEVTIMSVAYFAGDQFDATFYDIQEKLEKDARAALNQAKAMFDAKNIHAETVLELGLVPANNIIRRATEGKFDRVIMGSTGKSGLTLALIGSTASKVVTNAPCEVTIVR
ncbi:MAG: universal stress protein [Deltaproteobacteria bacterium]|nr:universal stress protein [Deltaproteobacteria bacterium]